MGLSILEPLLDSWAVEFADTCASEAAREAARHLDRSAVEIARSRGAIDLALGEALVRLFDADGLIKLGYSRRVDYSRERLGVPPRTMYEWVRLARAVAERPLLRRSVVDGSVTPRKALAVAPLAIGDAEARWVQVAVQLPLVELESVARAEGAGSTSEYGAVESLILRMTPEQQSRLDEAIALAQEQTGYAAPRWQCVEIICQEWLGAFGAWQPAIEGAESAGPALCVARQLGAARLARLHFGAGEPASEIDARIQRLLEGRRGFDMAFGVVAAQLVSDRIWPEVGYHCLEQYCRERLGVSPRAFRERVWLERRMCALPKLRSALGSGRLTYSKALLVAKDARPFDVEQRIDEATGTTWQQVDRESTREEDRQNLARGVRRIWGPEPAARTILDAIWSAQAVAEASGVGAIESGAALAIIATHFVEVWRAHRRRRPAARRREVILRHRGLCAVPGCSRPAQHEHHIHYRSRGGNDAASNLLGLCATHHLRGVHQGHLRVSGSAGERLLWHFGNGEEWETRGDDGVARP